MRLPPSRQAPSWAREWVSEALGTVPPDRREAVRLLVGELVASSVLHADRGPADSILVSLEISDGRVKVEVDDPGAGFEPLASPEPSPGEGHDVVLVDRIADRWGVRSDGVPGVWFEVVVA